jgi:hypothetical protein
LRIVRREDPDSHLKRPEPISRPQESNNFHFPKFFGDFKYRKSDRQLKPARSSASRVQVKHTSIVVLLGLMRVAADDRVESRCSWVEIDVPKIMEHIKTVTGAFDNRGEGKFPCPGLCVDIAAHSEHRGDEFELCENFRSAHVSRMKDELHTDQGLQGFGAEQAMSVRNDADPHGGRKRV